jgi:hypothetical protein
MIRENITKKKEETSAKVIQRVPEEMQARMLGEATEEAA